MVFAADYPFLEILGTMALFFCWVAWIWLLVLILGDVFRHGMSGWAKAGWCLFLIAVPFLGALTYIIAHGKDMSERRIRDAQVSRGQFDDRIRAVASNGNGGSVGEIQKAKSLLDSGAITQQEFEMLKAKALA